MKSQHKPYLLRRQSMPMRGTAPVDMNKTSDKKRPRACLAIESNSYDVYINCQPHLNTQNLPTDEISMMSGAWSSFCFTIT
jgi:hypothetical protein